MGRRRLSTRGPRLPSRLHVPSQVDPLPTGEELMFFHPRPAYTDQSVSGTYDRRPGQTPTSSSGCIPGRLQPGRATLTWYAATRIGPVPGCTWQVELIAFERTRTMREHRLIRSVVVLVLIATDWGCHGGSPGAPREVVVAFKYVQQNEAPVSWDPNWTRSIHSYAVSDRVLSTSWGAPVSLQPVGDRRFGAVFRRCRSTIATGLCCTTLRFVTSTPVWSPW